MSFIASLACSVALGQPNPAVFVNGSNDLGLKLLNSFGRTRSDNFMISPLSISLGVSLINIGAAGETNRQIDEALGVPYGAQDAYIQSIPAIMNQLNSSKDVEVAVANSIWLSSSLNVNPGYADYARQNLRAGVSKISFGPGAADKINQWISDNTRGKIKNVLGNIPTSAVVIVANAVYFKAFWANPFSESATKPLPFTGIDGKKVDVPMMKLTGHAPYFAGPGVDVLTLGYRGGYSMTIMLPDARMSAQQLLSQLNSAAFARLMNARQPARVEYTIPKWKSSFNVDLRNTLSQLGMVDAFLQQEANFSNLAQTQSFINILRHVTFIEVNEKGTEAAAVTVGGGQGGGGPKPEPPKIFVADRPFVYFITHDRTGLVCFTGVVNQLEAASPLKKKSDRVCLYCGQPTPTPPGLGRG